MLAHAWIQKVFFKGGPTLTTFFLMMGERVSKCHYKRDIIGPPAKRHLNGVSLAGRWWPSIECWPGSFVILRGIRTSIAKKPFIFVIFSGGPDPSPPPLDPRVLAGLNASTYGQQRLWSACVDAQAGPGLHGDYGSL